MGGTPGQKLSKLRDQSASSSVVSHAAGNLFCGLCADKGGLAQGPSSSAIKSRVFAASTPAESVKACRTLAARISIPPSVCCCSCSAAADATYTGPFQQVIVGHPDFIEGRYDIGWVERYLKEREAVASTE